MAVQARHHSNVLLLSSAEQQEMKMTDYTAAEGFPSHQSTVFFSNGASLNQRKRGREVAAPPPTMTTMSLSTGLRLTFEEEKHHQSQEDNHSTQQPPFPSLFSDDIAAQINQQREEIEQFLQSQGEQLRRTLSERRRRHHRALLCAAEEAASLQLREKEAAAEQAARRGAELEDRLARLRSESMAWQAKATAGQESIACLHAQLQQAAAAAAASERDDELLAAGDEESAFVDPRRVMELPPPWRACRACRAAGMSVVALPCRHLSLCTGCAASRCCPVCRCPLTGVVEVFLS